MPDTHPGRTTAKTGSWTEYLTEWRERTIPPRFRRLDTGRIHQGFRPVYNRVVESFKTEEPIGALLCGDVGKGKTSVLWMLAYELMLVHARSGLSPLGEWESNCRFVDYFQLQIILREFYERGRGESSRAIAGSASVPEVGWRRYLFIDDLGAGFEDKAGWNLSLLQQLINYRYEHCLPTYITTNKTLEELDAMAGWSRIVDRLRDKNWMITAVASSGESMRRTK